MALADPILSHGHDFVAPVYTRYKYDATITNNIAYNLTRALYGKRVRQPIGGDFGLSNKMIDFYLRCGKDIWMTDIARFGIDIWMTTMAIVENKSICQAYLGTKVHDVKDPLESLGPMFRQVVYPLFELMEAKVKEAIEAHEKGKGQKEIAKKNEEMVPGLVGGAPVTGAEASTVDHRKLLKEHYDENPIED